MTCKRCGRNVPVHSKVCPSCGLDNPNWQPRPAEAYTPPRQPSASAQKTNYTAAQRYSQAATEAKPAAPAKSKGGWKTVLVLAAVVVLIIVLINQCSGANRLKGTWEMADGSGSITFSDKENGYITLEHSMSSERTKDFTYFVEDDELELKTKTTLYSYGDVMRFRFKISGDKLTLTEVESEESMTFYKQ